jgi:hypothetical protein
LGIIQKKKMSDVSHISMFVGTLIGVTLLTLLSVNYVPGLKKHKLQFLVTVSVLMVGLEMGFIIYNLVKYPGSNFKDIWNPFDLLKKGPPPSSPPPSDTGGGVSKHLAPRGDKPADATLACEFKTASRAYSYNTDELIPQPTEGEYDQVTGQQITEAFDFKDLCVECDQYVYKDDEGDCVQYEYDAEQNEVDTVTKQGVCTVSLTTAIPCSDLPTV